MRVSRKIAAAQGAELHRTSRRGTWDTGPYLPTRLLPARPAHPAPPARPSPAFAAFPGLSTRPIRPVCLACPERPNLPCPARTLAAFVAFPTCPACPSPAPPSLPAVPAGWPSRPPPAFQPFRPQATHRGHSPRRGDSLSRRSVLISYAFPGNFTPMPAVPAGMRLGDRADWFKETVGHVESSCLRRPRALSVAALPEWRILPRPALTPPLSSWSPPAPPPAWWNARR